MRPIPAGSGDDGVADPALAAALTAGDTTAALGALPTARLLVPVTARALPASGGDGGSVTELALLQGADGRQAMLAFSGTDSMTRWSRSHRPVRGSGADLAREALERDLTALVLDVAGPHRLRVEGAALHALAEGRLPGVQARQASLRLRTPQRPATLPPLGPPVAEAYALEASEDEGATWQAVLGVVPAPGTHVRDLAAWAAAAGVAIDLLPLGGALLAQARQLARG